MGIRTITAAELLAAAQKKGLTFIPHHTCICGTVVGWRLIGSNLTFDRRCACTFSKQTEVYPQTIADLAEYVNTREGDSKKLDALAKFGLTAADVT